MESSLGPELQVIRDLELALGNTVAHVHEAFPGQVVVVFEEPIDRARIESTTKIEASLKWQRMGTFAGYVNEQTGQSVQGSVPPVGEADEEVGRRLSPSLRPIYDLELSLGNSVDRVDEPAGDRCDFLVVLKKPLHKAKIEAGLELSEAVTWWECRDAHYPIEGGYLCIESRHSIAGPLR